MSLEVAMTLVGVELLGKGPSTAVKLGDDVRFLFLFIATDDHQTIAYREKIKKKDEECTHVSPDIYMYMKYVHECTVYKTYKFYMTMCLLYVSQS